MPDSSGYAPSIYTESTEVAHVCSSETGRFESKALTIVSSLQGSPNLVDIGSWIDSIPQIGTMAADMTADADRLADTLRHLELGEGGAGESGAQLKQHHTAIHANRTISTNNDGELQYLCRDYCLQDVERGTWVSISRVLSAASHLDSNAASPSSLEEENHDVKDKTSNDSDNDSDFGHSDDRVRDGASQASRHSSVHGIMGLRTDFDCPFSSTPYTGFQCDEMDFPSSMDTSFPWDETSMSDLQTDPTGDFFPEFDVAYSAEEHPRNVSSRAQSNTFACPLIRLNPVRHRACDNIHLTRPSAVKQHLTRCHSADLTQEQLQSLRIRCPQRLPHDKQWEEVWKIVCPDRALPESVYRDGVLAEQVLSLRDFARRQNWAVTDFETLLSAWMVEMR